MVLEGAVGALLAHARDECKRTLRTVGAEAGVSRACVQQIEHSENIEIATLVRVLPTDQPLADAGRPSRRGVPLGAQPGNHLGGVAEQAALAQRIA